MSTEIRVAAVVVAYNRRDLLRESLAALDAQTRPIDAIVVIDNGSDDGTSDMVAADFPHVHLTVLPRNTGGAGGFTVGMLDAIVDHDADWLWIMDDDTVPTPDALAALLGARRSAPPRTTVLASRVVWTDGRDHPMNTPRRNPFANRSAVRAADAFDCYPIRSSSFVSLFVDADAVRRDGLPVSDYFLWNDDFEFTARLLRTGRGYLVRPSVVVHKTKVFGSTDADPGERFYLEVRNKLWLFRFSSALSLPEKAVYAGSTVRRWVRTVAKSTNRPVLWRGLGTGIRDGIMTTPRPNATVLADLDPGIVNGLSAFEAQGSTR
ncbi:MAG: glycosyltransferase family 2 protein [Mycetocola sp.]